MFWSSGGRSKSAAGRRKQHMKSRQRGVHFGEADHAGVREGHGDVRVVCHEVTHGNGFGSEIELEPEGTAAEHVQGDVHGAALPPKEKPHFREPASQTTGVAIGRTYEGGRGIRASQRSRWGLRRARGLAPVSPMSVVLLRSVQIGDESAGVGQNHLVHSPKPFMYCGLVARSSTPLRKQPQKGFASSKGVEGILFFLRPGLGLRRSSAAWRRYSDREMPSAAAARVMLSARDSGV